MTHEWLIYLCLFLSLWSAVIGGVFSAFSEFVMAGLLRAKPAGGIESMQHINRTVIKTQFVAGILVIPPVSIGLAVFAWTSLEGLPVLALSAASLIYVTSVFLMTIFGNVPMNNRLDSLELNAPEAEAYWAHYGRRWTRLNHVRTVGSVLTAIVYLGAAISLLRLGPT